jgi:RNA polymerase sigma-70 factor (ECF subfamily)
MLPAPLDPDTTLVARLRRGDRTAAADLLDGHLEPLYEFVHWRLGSDRAAADDVVQDTFVVALRRLDDFDARATMHAWLCGIAKLKIRELRKARGRARQRSIDEVLEESDDEIDRILSDLERTELPEQILQRRETQELVGATLSSLPPEYKAALLAKYVEQLSVGQIAAQSGRSEKAAESLLGRARTAFARVFELLAKKRGELS